MFSHLQYLCTTGVLTKPDTLTVGSTSALQKWKEILLSTSSPHHVLKHGYYCVRLADDVQRASDIELGTSRTDKQARELEFFLDTEPWASLRTGGGRGRFGVVNLVAETSKLLTGLLNEA